MTKQQNTSWKERPSLHPQSQLVADVERALRNALQELHEHSGGRAEDLAKRMNVSVWTLRKILHQYRVAAAAHRSEPQLGGLAIPLSNAGATRF